MRGIRDVNMLCVTNVTCYVDPYCFNVAFSLTSGICEKRSVSRSRVEMSVQCSIRSTHIIAPG